MSPTRTAQPTTQAQDSGGSALLLQRKCACGGSAGLSGECEECRTKRLLGKPLQAKLRINEPGDEYEREADRVADRVMHMPDAAVAAKSLPSADTPLVQRRVSAGNATDAGAAPSIVQDVLSSPGEPLDAATRDFFEPRFGHDFGHVRVHADPRAARSATAVNALAYTVGSHVVFGSRGDAPGTAYGRWLLAHELTHALQQHRAQSPQAKGLVTDGAGSTEHHPRKMGAARTRSAGFGMAAQSVDGAAGLQLGQPVPSHRSGVVSRTPAEEQLDPLHAYRPQHEAQESAQPLNSAVPVHALPTSRGPVIQRFDLTGNMPDFRSGASEAAARLAIGAVGFLDRSSITGGIERALRMPVVGPFLLSHPVLAPHRKSIELIQGTPGALEAIWDLIQNPEPFKQHAKETLEPYIDESQRLAIEQGDQLLRQLRIPEEYHDDIWKAMIYLAGLAHSAFAFVIDDIILDTVLFWQLRSEHEIYDEARRKYKEGATDTLDLIIEHLDIILSVIGRVADLMPLVLAGAGVVSGGALGGTAGSVVPGAGTAAGAGGGSSAGGASGLAASEVVGLALMLGPIALEIDRGAKATLELALKEQDEKQRQQDFGQIASSAFSLLIMGVLAFLPGLALRLGKKLTRRLVQLLPDVAEIMPSVKRTAIEGPDVKGGALVESPKAGIRAETQLLSTPLKPETSGVGHAPILAPVSEQVAAMRGQGPSTGGKGGELQGSKRIDAPEPSVRLAASSDQPSQAKAATGSDLPDVSERSSSSEAHGVGRAPSDMEPEASVARSSRKDSDQVTDQELANEIFYIDAHPELVTGIHPNRKATIGEHEIVRMPDGGCERHSGDGKKIPCPGSLLNQASSLPDERLLPAVTRRGDHSPAATRSGDDAPFIAPAAQMPAKHEASGAAPVEGGLTSAAEGDFNENKPGNDPAAASARERGEPDPTTAQIDQLPPQQVDELGNFLEGALREAEARFFDKRYGSDPALRGQVEQDLERARREGNVATSLAEPDRVALYRGMAETAMQAGFTYVAVPRPIGPVGGVPAKMEPVKTRFQEGTSKSWPVRPAMVLDGGRYVEIQKRYNRNAGRAHALRVRGKQDPEQPPPPDFMDLGAREAEIRLVEAARGLGHLATHNLEQALVELGLRDFDLAVAMRRPEGLMVPDPVPKRKGQVVPEASGNTFPERIGGTGDLNFAAGVGSARAMDFDAGRRTGDPGPRAKAERNRARRFFSTTELMRTLNRADPDIAAARDDLGKSLREIRETFRKLVVARYSETASLDDLWNAKNAREELIEAVVRLMEMRMPVDRE